MLTDACKLIVENKSKCIASGFNANTENPRLNRFTCEHLGTIKCMHLFKCNKSCYSLQIKHSLSCTPH